MPIFSSLLLAPTGLVSTLASGVVEKPQEGFSVQGELFEIPCKLIIELDKIEDAPFLFNLEPITLADGSKAFAYLYKQSIASAKMLSEGIWRC